MILFCVNVPEDTRRKKMAEMNPHPFFPGYLELCF